MIKGFTKMIRQDNSQKICMFSAGRTFGVICDQWLTTDWQITRRPLSAGVENQVEGNEHLQSMIWVNVLTLSGSRALNEQWALIKNLTQWLHKQWLIWYLHSTDWCLLYVIGIFRKGNDLWWSCQVIYFALRGGSGYTIGWIFGKIPNGLWPHPLSFSENCVAIF